MREGRVLPGRGNLGDRLAADDGLISRAGHVDDRRFAADGNGFCNATDLQIGIDRRDEASGELDAFASDSGKSGK